MRKFVGLASLGFAFSTLGCSPSQITDSSAGQKTSAGDSAYVLAVEPSGAVPVGDARKSAKTNDDITLVGLIGGSSDPFVEGMAAFTIVDPKVPYCAPDEGCPTPWDYCCETNAVKENIATVQVVDVNGKPVMSDARKLLNVKELNKVTVQGKAKRDSKGNLQISATKVFVSQGK